MSRLEDCARTAVGKGPLLVPKVIRCVPFANVTLAAGCAESAPAKAAIPMAATPALQSCDSPDIVSSIGLLLIYFRRGISLQVTRANAISQTSDDVTIRCNACFRGEFQDFV